MRHIDDFSKGNVYITVYKNEKTSDSYHVTAMNTLDKKGRTASQDVVLNKSDSCETCFKLLYDAISECLSFGDGAEFTEQDLQASLLSLYVRANLGMWWHVHHSLDLTRATINAKVRRQAVKEFKKRVL